jgi:arsenate reductase
VLAAERHGDEAPRPDAPRAERAAPPRERHEGSTGERALLDGLDVREDEPARLALREREPAAGLLEASPLLVALGGEEGGEAVEVVREVQTSRIFRRRMRGDPVLWFDARSSACKQTLSLLQARGVEPTLRRFLEDPPTPEELAVLSRRLGVPPHAIVRTDADEYQALRLSERTPDAELLEAIARHPAILVSPILVVGEIAAIARPPERVLDLVPPSSRT